MKNGKKRKAWTSVQVRELKTMARRKTPRRSNCPKVETDRRSNTTKSIQYRIVAQLALTNRRVEFFGYEAPPRAGLFVAVL